VRIDDFRASKEITEYLIEYGHTRIGYIKGHPNQTASARRLRAFRPRWRQPASTWTLRSCSRVTSPIAPIEGSREAAVPAQTAHRDLRQQRRHGRGRGFGRASARTRCAARPVRRRLRRHIRRDHRVAGTTVRQPVAAMADTAIDIRCAASAARNAKRRSWSTTSWRIT
jgi:DNA-binding LacI/PurR family transcriptional regulator